MISTDFQSKINADLDPMAITDFHPRITADLDPMVITDFHPKDYCWLSS